MHRHRSSECSICKDAESRLEIVNEKCLCFHCLGQHPVAKCSSSKSCLNCKRKHHRTICCNRQAGNQTPSSSGNKTTTSEASVLHSCTDLPKKGFLKKTATFKQKLTYCSTMERQSLLSPNSLQRNSNLPERAQRQYIYHRLAA